ncbi:MAG: RNA polymerase recycling motor ATPase HelR [Rhodococcus sp. (in: high G+C Gram-positive bacteria)]
MYDSIAFASADSLGHKSAAALIADDDRHFAAISASLARSIADVSTRLDAARKAEADMGQEVMERDFEVHRLAGRLRSLRRYGLDLCLGHTLGADGQTYRYIGRTGLLDEAGNELLIDWRSPAAEPFFGATHANPMGISRRRRYVWSNGRISDYWDEVFDVDQLAATDDTGDASRRAALDDQSAFIASLGSMRSPRMRDVLGTIQADQDAIIRAGSRGTRIVDGGPGTGKTVVALHRTAYLLYSDPRLHQRHGGVLFVGPHEPYLGYVANVLPSLGEEGVRTCTLLDLVVEGAGAVQESDPVVKALKSSTHMVEAIDAAVQFYEQPPTKGMVVETEWADLWLGPEDWIEAFDAPEPGTPHNEAREDIRRMLVTILLDKYDGDVLPTVLRTSLMRHDELTEALDGAWTLIDAADLVGDLWSVPAYLHQCASWLTTEQVRRLQRTNPIRWTTSDLPLLDAARQRLGDPGWSRRMRLREAAVSAERARMDRVVDELLQGPDEDGMIAQLRQEGIRNALVDTSALPADIKDALADPFAHIVVDEAQELTDAGWLMLLRRCPSRSFTIVGDRAQARHGFTENWRERLHRVGFDRIEISSLTVNYRTPEEVMAVAEPVIRAAIPDANVPTSIRSSGIPVRYGCVADLLSIVDTWLAENPDGTGCVVGESAFQPTARMRSLTPELTKGLEFDLVVLVDPARFGPGVEGAVDQYVAMTRATRQLVVLTNP